MKASNRTFTIGAVAIATAVTLFSGCATQRAIQPQQQQSMLTAAGFKALPATTPEQEHLLKSLPKDRVSPIRRQGKVYFVYPDASGKTLYVGQEAQYLAYEA